jgi:hypothetical protein
MTFRELEEAAMEIHDDFRENVSESRYGRLKSLTLESLPLMTGAALMGFGRATGNPELIGLPLVMDLFFGGIPSQSPRAFGRVMTGYAKFATGAALVYADKIGPHLYGVAQTLIDKI